MPRFYFHIVNGKEIIDEQGQELVNLDAAKVEAVRYAGAVLNTEKPTDIFQGIAWEVKVTDGPSPYVGRIYFTLTLTGKDE